MIHASSRASWRAQSTVIQGYSISETRPEQTCCGQVQLQPQTPATCLIILGHSLATAATALTRVHDRQVASTKKTLALNAQTTDVLHRGLDSNET